MIGPVEPERGGHFGGFGVPIGSLVELPELVERVDQDFPRLAAGDGRLGAGGVPGEADQSELDELVDRGLNRPRRRGHVVGETSDTDRRRAAVEPGPHEQGHEHAVLAERHAELGAFPIGGDSAELGGVPAGGRSGIVTRSVVVGGGGDRYSARHRAPSLSNG
jgi:hypothetical protein